MQRLPLASYKILKRALETIIFFEIIVLLLKIIIEELVIFQL